MRKTFSDPFLRSLQPDPTGQVDYVDDKDPHPAISGHLGIRVGKKAKSWFIRYSMDGIRRRHFIGKYPALSLAQARATATEKFTLIYNGKDPQGERAGYRSSPTFDDLWVEYEKAARRADSQKIKAGKKPTPQISINAANSRYIRHLKPVLGKMKLVDIKRLSIAKLLEGIAVDRPSEANQTFSLLSVIFNRGLNLGWIETHPMYKMQKPALEYPRDRFLSHSEIKTLWNLLPNIHQIHADVFKVLLLTGQRSSEVMSMKWIDLDFDKKLWTQSENKSDRPHQVPLSDQVFDILVQRQNDSDFVFPGRTSCGHIYKLQNSVNKLIKLSGVPRFVPHDLRRTCRTILAEIGTQEHIAERILNHSISGIIKVYNLHSYVPEMRESLDKLALKIYDIVK